MKSEVEAMNAGVEAMKTRKAATSLTQTLRDLNPALAGALVDERDQVLPVLVLCLSRSLSEVPYVLVDSYFVRHNSGNVRVAAISDKIEQTRA